MKKGSMPDEQLKTVLENSASAIMRITVHYLHFALIPMETEIEVDNILKILVCISNPDCVSQKSKPTIFVFQQKTDKLQSVYKKKENGTKTCYLKSIPPATKVGPQIK